MLRYVTVLNYIGRRGSGTDVRLPGSAMVRIIEQDTEGEAPLVFVAIIVKTEEVEATKQALVACGCIQELTHLLTIDVDLEWSSSYYNFLMKGVDELLVGWAVRQIEEFGTNAVSEVPD